MTKQKSLRKIFEWIIIFTAKILQEAMCLTSPSMNRITHNLKFYTIMQEIKRVLDFNCK